ncbi:MAG: hypothetical protein E7630_02800 [Ruminococcaceae bacterium]|nr:hypothetical protein [Oscillospiraceae bacterium]
MYPIFDAHTHVYPERIAQRAAINFANFYHFTVAESGTFESLLSCEKKAGIGGMLLLPVATSWKNVDKINESAASWAALARKAGFQAWAFGSVNAECPDLSAVLSHIESLGLKGIKLHPDLQGEAVDSPRLYPVYEWLEQKGLRLYLHVGDDRPTVDGSSPERVATVARDFPKLTICAAHLGGYRVWDRAERVLMGRYDNVWYDCATTLDVVDPARGKALIETCGLDRVFFGSDFPAISPEVSLSEFNRLDLDETARKAILHDNLLRFLGEELL